MGAEEPTWSVGELAAATGLTVRTLHHYDEIGLVRPSRRNAAGHRRYTAGDVRRLHRVVALRGFGFSLAEIAALLDGDGSGGGRGGRGGCGGGDCGDCGDCGGRGGGDCGGCDCSGRGGGGGVGGGLDVRELVLRQLDQVVDRITRASELRDRLEVVLAQFDAVGDPSAGVLVRLIEGTTAVEHTYTPEELERMAAYRRESSERLSSEELAAMSARRQEAWDGMTGEQRAELVRNRPALPG
ncbi:hypothetical protein Ahu01nite_083750 [Winogradskya humida]|uniref:HTH merR-type domain-containing protein n=1 Tax=Winogradskya humida TaxID=113566 RepID=A0ABQ4A363_9ACTN|nr:hypothetical protein Ahu01nite_083750 [Actinoplanes humidus]